MYPYGPAIGAPFTSSYATTATGTAPYGAHMYTYNPANYYVGMYSALNSGSATDKAAGAHGPTAFVPRSVQQSIAASVVSLPPRAEFINSTPAEMADKHERDESEARSKSASTEPQEPPASTSKEDSLSLSPGLSPPKEPSSSPEVMEAIEELTALSSLDPEQLTEALNLRPQLREAVKILLAHQTQLNAGLSSTNKSNST